MRAILTGFAGAWLAAGLTLVAVGCGGVEESPDTGAAGPRSGPPPEAISVRIGGREVRVRCGVSCGEVTSELSRLDDGCMHDPMSTPHHVVAEGSLLSLGCCTEARAAYEQACGIEAVLGCVSAWGARCESGAPLR